MYINNKKGGFIEKLKGNVGHISQYSMGCDAADINNDGLIDISVVDMAPANNYRSKTQMPSMSTDDFIKYTEKYNYIPQYSYNSLLLNVGQERYSEIAKLSGIHKTDWSWSSLLADFDNDGLKDQFVTNGYMHNRMENDFAIRFDSMMISCENKPSEKTRIEWMSLPPSYKLSNYLWRNNGNLQFENVTDKWGMDNETFSNGAAYADFDNDGDLDLIVNNLNDMASLFENTSANNYFQITLKNQDISNFSASLNAKVVVYVEGESFVQELSLTRGFQSSSTAILHFGLGDRKHIDSLSLYIPNMGYLSLKNVTINQRMAIDISDKKLFKRSPFRIQESETIFEKIHRQDLGFSHQENDYNDFTNERLLPHKNSKYGPFISVADVNDDGLDDMYIGAPTGQSAVLYTQNEDGYFRTSNVDLWFQEAKYEDMKSCFFDVDSDGDLDLYVVSGGNEWKMGDVRYQDRLYLNDGNGNFEKSIDKIPDNRSSGSVVIAVNIDDRKFLFVGGRMLPQNYPYPSLSKLFEIKDNKLVDVSADEGISLSKLGIVTDAISVNIIGDETDELLIVGEWMHPVILSFNGGKFEEVTPTALKEDMGWWNAVKVVDLDGDGDLDFIAGNLGLNYKYKASKDEPFSIYANDFDESGNIDIVLSYHSDGTEYPVRGRECSSEQMPMILNKFPTYHEFANSSIEDVLGSKFEEAKKLIATEFSSCIFWNDGNGNFTKKHLPIEAQFSCVNDIITNDFNNDGQLDILLAGNMYASEIETPRNDASFGCLLIGKRSGSFEYFPNRFHQLYASGDVKSMETINVGTRKLLLVGNNSDSLNVFSIRKLTPPPNF